MTRTDDLTSSDADFGVSANDSNTPDLPAAVLWDMDGTLVDTEPYWFASERDLVDRFGHGEWPDEHAHAMVGFDLRDSAVYMQEHGGVDLPADEIVERLLDGVIARLQRSIPWQPGARELLAELNEAGVPCALVTMSWRRFVDPVLAALPDGSFVTTVTGDAVPVGHGKPHPDPYLIAADAVGAAPEDCLAIEDSPTGVRSALDASCRVLGVPNIRDLTPEPGLTVIESLADVHASDLDGVMVAPPIRRAGARRRSADPSHRRIWLLVAFAAATAVIIAIAIGTTEPPSSSRSADDGAADAATDAVTFDPWVTFPEGLTIDEMANVLAARRPDLDPDAFVTAARTADAPPQVGATRQGSLEGLLFPNTYRVDRSGEEVELVAQMLGLMDRVAREEQLADRAAELGVTPYEAITIASMIEKEAGTDADRPLIARVIYNRLERGMPLQIDATVYYGQDRSTPFPELRKLDTPFNTYLYQGLPPTPIANPGQPSIRAALNPAANPTSDDDVCLDIIDPLDDCVYLFYVRIAADGSHRFASTYEQHLANVEEAREAGVL